MLSKSPQYAKRIISTIIHLYSTIFKTIDDETTISGQRIVGALQARKIAQEQATAQLEIDIACLKKYEIACKSGSVSMEQFDSIMKKSSVTAKEYTTNIQKGTGSAQSYAQAQKANNVALQSVGVGAGIASKAVKLLSATMNTIAFTAIFSLISKGISWVTEQIDNYIHRNEIAIEKAEELLGTFKSEIDTITSNQDKINGYADEFKELSRGVDDLGRNVSLTADEYARYQSIVKEIVGINPSLISGYDEGNNILANKNGLIETSIQLLKDEYNQKLKNLALPDNIDTAIKGAISRYNSSKEDFLEVKIPTTLAFSGVKIDENGNRKAGYVNQISQYIEDIIGVEFTGWEGGINQYILNNAEAVFDNLDKIKERASQTKDGWEGLNDSQLIDLMDYFKELRIAYNDMNNATTSANPTLQYVAMAEDSYSQLTDIQKKFVADYVNGIQITSETAKQEKDNIRKSIISLTQELSKLDDTEVNNALAKLYAIPTDEQSIGEFIEQFRSALEVVQTYCKENGIEIPISISDSEQTINDLEAQYQRAVDFAKDKFDGYDPTEFFKEHSINTQEEIDAWQKIAQGARDTAEAEKEYVQGSTLHNKTLVSSLSEDKIKSIDDYKNKLKELYAALNLLRTGEMTPSDMDELIKKFPELSEYVDDFDDGIRKLINDTLQLFAKSFNGLTGEDDLKSISKFSVMQEEVTNSIETTTNAINNLTSSYQTLDKAVREYNENGYLSLETLENLMKLKPEYLASIIDEEGNLKDVTEVYKELIDLKLKEFETDAYKKVNLVQSQLREEYKGYLARSEDIGRYDEEYKKKHQEYTNKFDASQRTLEQELKFIDSLRLNLDKTTESLFGDSSTSDFNKQIDWASHSISILQNKISLLQEELSNTSGYDKQIQKLKDIMELQGELYGGYEKARDEYQKKYENVLNNGILAEHGLTEIIKENIEKGANFSIEDFIANNVKSGDTIIQQQIYEAIQEAIDCYNKKSDAEKSSLKIKAEIDESEMSKHDVWRKKWETQIDRIRDNQQFINDTINFNGGKGKDRDKYYNALIRDETEIRKIVFDRWKYETKLLKDLKPENDKYAEQEKIVQECAKGLTECDKNIKNWQLDIVRLELEAIDDEIESINDKIKNNQDEIDQKDKLISGAIGIINQEVKIQEDLRDVIQDRIDALQKENDEYERALNLEKAKYELQRAYSQRTVKLYSGKERGFIYTQDRDAVHDAQENLDKLEYEDTIHALQKQVDYYDDIIDNLNDIKNIWSNISSAAQEFLNIEYVIAKYKDSGVDIKDSILFNSYDTDELTQSYKDLLHLGDEFNNNLKKQEDLKSDLEEIIEEFQTGAITFEQCLTDIGKLLGKVYDDSKSTIQQSVEEIVKSTDTIPAEIDNVNKDVEKMEKNTKESTNNINGELSEVSDNVDKKSLEAAEKVTENLKSELERQRIILEGFYEYVDNIFINMRFSALDNFKKIAEGINDTVSSVQEEIENIIKNGSVFQNSFGGNNLNHKGVSVSSIKNNSTVKFNDKEIGLMNNGGLITTKDNQLDNLAHSLGEDHITLLGYKEGECILTPAENEIWEKMNDVGISLMPNITPDISSHSIKFPDIGTIQNKTTPVVQHVNVTIPNITNENGFNKFKQELERLQLDALQYSNKR